VVDELPRNPMGKLDKAGLRRQLGPDGAPAKMGGGSPPRAPRPPAPDGAPAPRLRALRPASDPAR
jgi:hypothetical protein